MNILDGGKGEMKGPKFQVCSHMGKCRKKLWGWKKINSEVLKGWESVSDGGILLKLVEIMMHNTQNVKVMGGR